MTNIEALVAEYGTVMKAYGRSLGVGDRLIAIDHSGSADRRFEAIRNALTEQAESFKGELQAYDGMVRELTKTVEDMRAAQFVPVVGEPVAYLKADAAGKVLWSEDCVCEDAVWPGEDSEFGEYSLPVYHKPTTSIPAAELATLREKAAMADELRKDAERLPVLEHTLRHLGRELAKLDKYRLCMSYNDSYFGEPAGTVKLVVVELRHCIDAAIAQGKGE